MLFRKLPCPVTEAADANAAALDALTQALADHGGACQCEVAVIPHTRPTHVLLQEIAAKTAPQAAE